MGVVVPFKSQLIDQAHHLAAKDPGRPLQANLRRAVSGAYYALFHCLVADVTGLMLGQNKEAQPLRHVMARTFGHTEMAEASKSFSKAVSKGFVQLHDSIRDCIPSRAIHPGVATMCSAFVVLQEARHKADYDLSERLSRNECVAFVQRAEGAIQAWNAAARDPSARAYMLSLLMWKKMRRD